MLSFTHVISNATSTIQIFFSVRNTFVVPITSKKTPIKREKGGSLFSFHRKKTTKGQFWLQMIILREGTGVSFKTNTFSQEELSKSLLQAFGLERDFVTFLRNLLRSDAQ